MAEEMFRLPENREDMMRGLIDDDAVGLNERGIGQRDADLPRAVFEEGRASFEIVHEIPLCRQRVMMTF